MFASSDQTPSSVASCSPHSARRGRGDAGFHLRPAMLHGKQHLTHALNTHAGAVPVSVQPVATVDMHVTSFVAPLSEWWDCALPRARTRMLPTRPGWLSMGVTFKRTVSSCIGWERDFWRGHTCGGDTLCSSIWGAMSFHKDKKLRTQNRMPTGRSWRANRTCMIAPTRNSACDTPPRQSELRFQGNTRASRST